MKKKTWTKHDSLLVLYALSERDRIRTKYFDAYRKHCLAIETKEKDESW